MPRVDFSTMNNAQLAEYFDKKADECFSSAKLMSSSCNKHFVAGEAYGYRKIAMILRKAKQE